MIGRKLHFGLFQKALILVMVPVVFQLVFLGSLLFMLQQAEREVTRESCARSLLAHVRGLTKSLTSGAAIGYNTLSGKLFLEGYQNEISAIPDEVRQLQELGGLSPEQVQKLRNFGELVEELKEKSTEGRRLLETGHTAEGAAILDSLTGNLARVWMQSENVLVIVRKIEQENPAIQTKSRQTVQMCLWIAVLFNISLAIGLAIAFNRDTIRRLSNLMQNVARLSDGLPLSPPLKGTDELAVLDEQFHRMVAALQEAARKERAIVEKAVDVICSLDRDLVFTNVNPASLTTWGFEPRELVGRNITDLVLSEDRAKVEQSMKSLIAPGGILSGSVSAFESRVKCRDESVVIMLWSPYWSDPDQSFFCVSHNITQRKQLEQDLRDAQVKLAAILSSMGEGLCHLDQQGRIIYVNPAGQQILGYPEGDMIDQSMHDLVHLNSNCKSGQNSQDCPLLVNIMAMSNVCSEDWLTRKDSTLFPVHYVSAPLTLDGISKGVVVSFRDITEQKEAEKRIKEFYSIVSHELRTPLTSIRGAIGLLESGKDRTNPEKIAKLVKIVRTDCDRLIRLINDILDLKKIEAGKLDTHMQSLDAGDLVVSVMEKMHGMAAEAGVQLKKNTQEIGSVRGDPDRVIQVLANLVSNAIKFSPADTTVTIATEYGTNDRIRFSVSDQGPGIPKNQLHKLFGKFQQLDSSSTRKVGGSGLGLAISKAIVEQHGGEIGVDTVADQGSTFWFELPRATSASSTGLLSLSQSHN